MASYEIHPEIARKIYGAIIAAGVRPVAFTRQMNPEKATLSVYKVHVMSNMDTRGRVKLLSFVVANMLIRYIGHWEIPFPEARTAIAGAEWHKF